MVLLQGFLDGDLWLYGDVIGCRGRRSGTTGMESVRRPG